MRVLSTLQAKDLLCREGTGGSLSSGDFLDVVIAEYLRQALCDLSAFASPPRSAVFVTSVTNNVRRQLRAVWPSVYSTRVQRPSQRDQKAEGDLHPDAVRRVLETLEDLQEVSHLGGGYYAPTPTRLVQLDPTAVMVVGGTSTRDLRKQLPFPIRTSWIARLANPTEIPESWRVDEVVWQTVANWVGQPPTDLASWTADTLDRARNSLSTSAADTTEFEIYAPSSRTNLQWFRWVLASALTRLPSGLVLCRETHQRFGARRYWLGTIARTRKGMMAEKEFAVDAGTMRRLLYGLDQNAAAPTTVEVVASAHHALLRFENLIPPPERRAVIALCREVSAVPGKFPLIYELESQHLEFILELIKKLGVTIRQTSSLKRR